MNFKELDITEIVLNHFSNVLCKNRDSVRLDTKDIPPSTAFVQRKTFSTSPWKESSIYECWIIEDFKSVVKVEKDFKPPTVEINGMFFSMLIGNWGLSECKRQVSINWQTGPRFGRGNIFPILQSPEGKMYLGDGTQTWIS